MNRNINRLLATCLFCLLAWASSFAQNSEYYRQHMNGNYFNAKYLYDYAKCLQKEKGSQSPEFVNKANDYALVCLYLALNPDSDDAKAATNVKEASLSFLKKQRFPLTALHAGELEFLLSLNKKSHKKSMEIIQKILKEDFPNGSFTESIVLSGILNGFMSPLELVGSILIKQMSQSGYNSDLDVN